MNKKCIMLDVDGTILNTNNEIPTSAIEAIRGAQAAGHIVVIATGRAPYFIEDIRKQLGITSFICFNGQYVEADGKVIYQNPMDPVQLKKLTEAANNNGHAIVYMGREAMRSTVERTPLIDRCFASIDVDSTKIFTHPTYYQEADIFQTLLFCDEDKEQPYLDEHHYFQYIRWHEHSLDVLPLGGSKANGIAHYIQHHGIAMEDVYAFGDNLNDIEMLQAVGHGVAMGNAPTIVKEAARHTTAHVDEDGLAEGFKRFGLWQPESVQ